VTYETVPTLDHVRGIAIYGPGATLFTLGRNNTAQQFDLNSPPQLVANVQHPANLLPPSPPVSIEEQKKGSAKSSDNSIPINVDVVSESDEDHMSPLARIAREMDKLEERQNYGTDRRGALSPVSSQASSTSRSSAGSRPFGKSRQTGGSVLSRGLSDHTLMSPGSSIHSRDPSVISSRDSFSVSSVSSSQFSGRSRPRGSRLRQEVLRSPEEKVVVDLFKFTKSRLSDIPYAHPSPPNNNLNTNELRRQMLQTIFGWEGEAEDLIRDELQRHPIGSPNRILLTKWLGDIDTDIMASSSESMTSSDWMLLALSGIGGQASQQKVARAYVQRLLEKGDVHTAATIMIGMGDQNDAIEIYVSHKRYMEALILTCSVYPADWGRQTQLIRKWGEWAVQHSQQQLAIRCFSCTGTEANEPYFSPTAQTLTFNQSQLQTQGIPEMLSPPLSPPGVVPPRGPQRNMAKTAALKLVTSFDNNKTVKSKFFGADGDRTPMNNVGTPIAESALSPSGDATAFLRPSNRSVFNTPASATRTATPGGYTRNRLPSIGEMPTDVTPVIKMPTITLPTPRDQTANDLMAIAQAHQRKSSQPETLQLSSATYQPITRASTASPMMQRAAKVSNPLPSPSPDSFTQIKQESRARNGSRGRKPDGLQIQWPPMESIITGDYMTTPELSSTSTRHRTPTARSVTGSVAGSVSSVSSSVRSYRSVGVSSPITGRSLDPYISSLESAQHYVQKQKVVKQTTTHQSGRGRSSSRKAKARDQSADRGRSSGRTYIKPAKRSPTSPVPMSPEDLRDLGAFGYGDERFETSSTTSEHKSRIRDGSQATARPGSKASSRIRRMSPEPVKFTDSRPGSRLANRQASRRASPEPAIRSLDVRGRSKARDGSVMRSPSSPLPMSTEAKFYHRDVDDDADDDEFDLKAAKKDRERFRSRHRSTSRMRERAPSSTRHTSPERRKGERSRSRAGTGRDSARPEDQARRAPRAPSHTRSVSDLKAGDLSQMKTERQLKKESAARELEERRRSLARRPSAPPIVHPEQLSPPLFRSASRNDSLRSSTYPSPHSVPSRSQTVSPESQRQSPSFFGQPTRSTVQIGLPATPKAMQHPKYDPDGKDIPEVPQIPTNYNAPPQVSEDIAYNNAFENLAPLPQTTFAPLPKTTYQAAPRHVPPRSMSAPIPEEPLNSPRALPSTLPTHPAFQATLPPSSRRRLQDMEIPQRKVNPGDVVPGTLGYETRVNQATYSNSMNMGGIEEILGASISNNNMMPPPPPPPPAPPILRELQHLAQPPPPPPAPLYRIVSNNGPGTYDNNNTNSLVSGVSLGSQGSGVIEIVMDDEEEQAPPPSPPKPTLAQLSAVPPPPPPPPVRHGSLDAAGNPAAAPRQSILGHNRGRSINEKEKDNSISGRISRATERMRSASRGRNTASPQLNRTKSPIEHSPYESVPQAPPQWAFEQSVLAQRQAERQAQVQLQQQQQQAAQQGLERHPRDVRATMMEGGMI
jgi:hypothetical protein